MTATNFTLLLLFVLIVINTAALVCMGLLLNYFKKWEGQDEDYNSK